MKLTIESTPTLTTYNGAKCRVWTGVTERGVKCGLFIVGLAVHNDNDQSQFDAELRETSTPTEVRTARQVFDARMF